MLKALIMSFMLEGGIIPGHEVSLYPIGDPGTKNIIDFRQTCYVDMQAKLRGGPLYLAGGMTCYEWAFEQPTSFYPFRMDYNLEIGSEYKSVTVGVFHGCKHPVLPMGMIMPYGKLDVGFTTVFARFSIEKKLFE